MHFSRKNFEMHFNLLNCNVKNVNETVSNQSAIVKDNHDYLCLNVYKMYIPEGAKNNNGMLAPPI